jgi:hypothetical protein
MSSAVFDPLSRASGRVAQGGKATAGRIQTDTSRWHKRGTSLHQFTAFVSFLHDSFDCFTDVQTAGSIVTGLLRPFTAVGSGDLPSGVQSTLRGVIATDVTSFAIAEERWHRCVR